MNFAALIVLLLLLGPYPLVVTSSSTQLPFQDKILAIGRKLAGKCRLNFTSIQDHSLFNGVYVETTTNSKFNITIKIPQPESNYGIRPGNEGTIAGQIEWFNSGYYRDTVDQYGFIGICIGDNSWIVDCSKWSSATVIFRFSLNNAGQSQLEIRDPNLLFLGQTETYQSSTFVRSTGTTQ